MHIFSLTFHSTRGKSVATLVSSAEKQMKSETAGGASKLVNKIYTYWSKSL